MQGYVATRRPFLEVRKSGVVSAAMMPNQPGAPQAASHYLHPSPQGLSPAAIRIGQHLHTPHATLRGGYWSCWDLSNSCGDLGS
jgi:hypothetical protein